MAKQPTNPGAKDYLQHAVDIAVRLSLVALFVIGCLKIFSPFLVPVVWAAIIAIALYPIFQKLDAVLGGRRKVAGAVFILVTLALVLVPAYFLSDSLLDGTVRIVKQAEAGTLEIPPPTEKVKTWPLIGPKTYALWEAAHLDLAGTMAKLQPQLGRLGQFVVRSVSGLGVGLLKCVLALIIAGILLVKSEGAGNAMNRLGRRLAGSAGEEMVRTANATIRSVVKGVILVALIQAMLAAIGLKIASVPATGLWALLVMILAVIQISPILILGPIAAWVFANNDSTGIAIFFAVWSLMVVVSDNFLKPIFLGRGVKVPMLVILIGAIGGMLRSGVVGLFIGPVVLAIGYQLMVAWMGEDRVEEAAKPPAGS